MFCIVFTVKIICVWSLVLCIFVPGILAKKLLFFAVTVFVVCMSCSSAVV